MVAAALDAREVATKSERTKRIFRPVDSEIHTPSDQYVLSTGSKYSRAPKIYVDPTVAATTQQEPNKLCLKNPIQPAGLSPVFVHSTSL